jgi:hypothetical protein
MIALSRNSGTAFVSKSLLIKKSPSRGMRLLCRYATGQSCAAPRPSRLWVAPNCVGVTPHPQRRGVSVVVAVVC